MTKWKADYAWFVRVFSDRSYGKETTVRLTGRVNRYEGEWEAYLFINFLGRECTLFSGTYRTIRGAKYAATKAFLALFGNFQEILS